MQRYKFDHYVFQLIVCSLLHNYVTCYTDHFLNENLKNCDVRILQRGIEKMF